jgi:hypothetical protein
MLQERYEQTVEAVTAAAITGCGANTMDDLPCGVPFARQAAKERRRRLIREAIKYKHGQVNSIAPEDLNKLVTEYQEDQMVEALTEILRYWLSHKS